MKRIENEEGITWLEYEILSQFPKLKHGVFLRKGGTSSGPYDSLNVSDDVGDSSQAVKNNKSKIEKTLDLKQIAFSKQVHGKQVELIDRATIAASRTCDGLMTNLPCTGLMIMHADCQAVLFYDPINHAIANAHAGWRGSVQNIFSETIAKMKQSFGSSPNNLHVCISPSLGPQKAEFINFKNELPEQFWEYQIKPFYFDFWEISRQQLLQCGILDSHIEIAKMCTYTLTEDFFSYRRDKITGRHASLISIS